MIVVRLNGGLGNQMFQLAAGQALALRIGTKCKVDLSTFQRSIRKYELNCFTGAPEIAGADELPLNSRLGRSGMPAVLANFFGKAFGKTLIFEERSPFVFDDRFSQLQDNCYIIGYFQSEKYFQSIARNIREIFAFTALKNPGNEQVLEQIATKVSISVHVRRGDYVSVAKTNKFYGTCSLDYYQAAFQYLAERLTEVCFFVFSDDARWARENIKPPSRTIYVNHNTGKAGFEDMRLMSHCQHHIIANSSFSWWAAWLNPSPDKIVIAPRQWLNDRSVSLKDLIPRTWTSI